MAAAITGILNHVPNSVNGAKPMAGSSGNTGSTTTADANSPGITANDFLTLLVTELKNQDPTANTDPNAYINQLVGVNSLQQLIKINETLTSGLSTPAAGAGNRSGSGQPAYAPASKAASSSQVGGVDEDTVAASYAAAQPQDPRIKAGFGNLAVPEANAAAHRVALALSGH